MLGVKARLYVMVEGEGDADGEGKVEGEGDI